jgi:hypothetical protein
MPTEIKLWKIEDNQPVSISKHKIELEAKLEDWISGDIGLISNDLLVIGRQVPTEFGGIMDVLALDYEGNLVVIELKRDKTPRDIVAQVLDYASCIESFTAEKISETAADFLGKVSLEDAFKEKFETEFPEVLNESCRIYIVAAQIDNASERIVKYLSERYGMDINIITFNFFKTPAGEILARSAFLDEDQSEGRRKSSSKRLPPKTWGEFEAMAERAGVLDIYTDAITKLRPFFDTANRTLSCVSFGCYFGDSKSRKGLLSIFPSASSAEIGLAIGIKVERLCEYFGISEDNLKTAIGDPDPEIKTRIAPLIATGTFRRPSYGIDSQRLERFIELLKQATKQT